MRWLLSLIFVIVTLSSATATETRTEFITEEVCHAVAGCWINPKTGECPDCVLETREVVHPHEEKPVVVKKSFVEPKRTFWTPKKIVKVDLPKKKEIIKKKGNWTCIVGPCDFIDEDGNLIKKS